MNDGSIARTSPSRKKGQQICSQNSRIHQKLNKKILYRENMIFQILINDESAIELCLHRRRNDNVVIIPHHHVLKTVKSIKNEMQGKQKRSKTNEWWISYYNFTFREEGKTKFVVSKSKIYQKWKLSYWGGHICSFVVVSPHHGLKVVKSGENSISKIPMNDGSAPTTWSLWKKVRQICCCPTQSCTMGVLGKFRTKIIWWQILVKIDINYSKMTESVLFGPKKAKKAKIEKFRNTKGQTFT